MDDGWRIRKAVEKDAPEMYEVLVDSIRGLTGGEYTARQQRAWINSVGREYFRTMIALEQHDVWVAEWSDGGMLAFAALHADEVSYLYVRSNYVGLGLGTQLITRMERTARRRGERKLYLRSSLTARGFYERRGFRVVREVMLFRQGVYLPSVVMEKDLF